MARGLLYSYVSVARLQPGGQYCAILVTERKALKCNLSSKFIAVYGTPWQKAAERTTQRAERPTALLNSAIGKVTNFHEFRATRTRKKNINS